MSEDSPEEQLSRFGRDLDSQRRPFDPWLKRLIEDPRVARALFGVGPVSVMTNVGYYPAQDVFFPDYVGRLKDDTLLHIELESAPGPEMRQRLLDYAGRIIAAHGEKAHLQQHVLYNGDPPLEHVRSVRRFNHGAVNHRYTLTDLGAVIGPDVLRRRDLNVAKLAFLSRDVEDLAGAVRFFKDKAERQLGGKRYINTMTQVVKLASLRRRGHLVVSILQEIDPMLAREMAKDPYIQSQRMDGRRETLLELMQELSFEVPSDFQAYVRSEVDVEALSRIGRALMRSPASFDALLEQAGPLADYTPTAERKPGS